MFGLVGKTTVRVSLREGGNVWAGRWNYCSGAIAGGGKCLGWQVELQVRRHCERTTIQPEAIRRKFHNYKM